jgi:hypothetical protein
MSTARLIDRTPAASRRRRIQSRAGAVGSTPRTARAVNLSQPAGSSTVTWYAGRSVAVLAPGTSAGSRKATPSECESSRASPRTDRQ